MRASLMLVLVAAITACNPSADPGVDVSLADDGAGNPTVAIDNRTGAAFAAWIGTTPSGSNVYLARVDRSGRGAPVRVNDIEGDAAPHEQAPPQVAVAPGGTIYVVWQNNTVVPGRRFPASNLRFARSTDGGQSFAPAIFVNDDAFGEPSSHTFHDLAVADDGTVYVSWIDGRERSRVEVETGRSGMHDHSTTLPGSEVRVARSEDGGQTFTSGIVVHRDVCPCCRTSLAVDGAGVVAVAFRSATDDIRDMLVARSSDAGETFGEPVRVHADGWQVDACPHAGASIAFDADGHINIAWYTGAASRQGLWYARSTSDTSFGEPVALQTGDWVPVSQVKLAVADDGAVWIAWDDRREEESSIHLATARAGRVTPVRTQVAGRSPAIAAAKTIVLGRQQGSGAAVQVLSP